ncbi:MAG: valine--tRNA ligase [Patescibacteria group bacterium]|nr:valine--tRNA ligase [Patescibacteria group bacterium]
MPKAYNASSVEGGIYASWEKSGAFKPHGDGEPYCIVMPPPNRTGVLHLGHAVMLAIEDLLIRYHRMLGKRTLWIPGTDHAAIATQVKVEQELIKKGIKNPREELGREKLLQEVVKFADESATTIRSQVRKMGSSCDWSREKYTLDEERTRAVNEMFKMMYEDGIIEQGHRLVNWDPQFQTTLSDDEVEHKETMAKFLTFKYDSSFPIAISTTRPETKFGDTAVAVNPDDKRYQKFVGKTFEPIFCGKRLSIKVIADKAVDPDFGTGALGVTPAHSMVDAEMAERHGLPMVCVIGTDARMTEDAGEDFAGLAIEGARKKIYARLQEEGLIEKEEEIPQNLPIAQRGGAPVEQLPMKQWFVRVNKPFKLRQTTLGKWKKGDKTTLKELMRHAVEARQIKIVPDRFEKIYFHWIDNLHDWCISRQIWFGHRIPVWYKKSPTSYVLSPTSNIKAQDLEPRTQDEIVVSPTSPGPDWEQDPDTLDTWFSSGLWTFSTLGWPPFAKATGGKPDGWLKMREFHPTAVLETGYDILFFWVARMVLMSTYALGEVPFKDVYLHGLVRDEQGRKMSKTLGNVIDPLDMIAKYGTDAVRLALLIGTTPGQDTKLSEEKIAGFRNFTNKLWNISRFILTTVGDYKLQTTNYKLPPHATLADRWILSHISEVAASVTSKIEKYEFSSAGEELRDFTWGDLADWYLEIAKIEKGKEEILANILPTILKLWHPFMPFVTEHVWKIAGFGGDLIMAEWPTFVIPAEAGIQNQAKDFEVVRQIITDIRRFRAEQGIEPVKKIEVAVSCPVEIAKLLEDNKAVAEHLARASSITVVDSVPEGWAMTVYGAVTIALNVAGSIDVEKERAKLEKEVEETASYVKLVTTKLQNKEFISKAPEKVVQDLKARLDEAEIKLEALNTHIQNL